MDRKPKKRRWEQVRGSEKIDSKPQSHLGSPVLQVLATTSFQYAWQSATSWKEKSLVVLFHATTVLLGISLALGIVWLVGYLVISSSFSSP
jgi:hypothetical protein